MDDPLKKAKEKAAASYNSAADHFDDEPLSFWDLISKRTVTNLKLQAGAKVLDVGCGTGASALPAAQAVGKNGFVVGVDLAAKGAGGRSRQCRVSARRHDGSQISGPQL